MSNTKDTPFHRYALVDKTGKTRATCLGNGPKDRKGAAAAFKRQRGGNPIPEGWKVVDRGPVEPPKAVPTPAPAPRPFKVGDRVRVVTSIEPHHVGPNGTEYTIVSPCPMETSGCWVGKRDDGTTKHLQPGFTVFELVEPQHEATSICNPHSTMFKIEKGIPIPPIRGAGRPKKYPFADMEVGDSFAVPVNRSDSLKISARMASKRLGMAFAVAIQGDVVRCWRTK